MPELPGGYAFKLDLSMGELKERLAQLGHGMWQDWESTVYGDYIFGHLWGVRMRIFDGQGCQSEYGMYDPAGFMVLDYARGEWTKRTEELHIRIVDILFPALGITEWKPDDGND